MNKIDADLKSCPCCGGKATMYSIEEFNLEDAYYGSDLSYHARAKRIVCYKVLCNRCSIRTCKLATKKTAINAWNRRK